MLLTGSTVASNARRSLINNKKGPQWPLELSFYYAAERTYVCAECDLRIDRDLNAAHNIRNFIIESGRLDLR